MCYERFEIAVTEEQRNAVGNAARRDQRVDGLANRNAERAQGPEMLGGQDSNLPVTNLQLIDSPQQSQHTLESGLRIGAL